MDVSEIALVWCGVVVLGSLFNAGLVWVFRDSFDQEESAADYYQFLSWRVATAIILPMGAFVGVRATGLVETFPVLDPFDLLEMALFFWLLVSASGLILVPSILANISLRSSSTSFKTILLATKIFLFFYIFILVAIGTVVLALAFDALFLVVLSPVLFGFVVRQLFAMLRNRAIRERHTVGEPTDDEWSLIESAIDETGFDPDRVTFLTGEDDANLWRPWTVGLGPYRRLYVPRRSFEDYSSEALRAVLVRLTWRWYDRSMRVLVWLGYLSLLIALLVIPRDGIWAVVFLVGFVVVLAWPYVWYRYGCKRVYAVDRAVAETVGPAALYESFERQVALADGGANRILGVNLLGYLRLVPSTHDRMERLATEFDIDSGAPAAAE